MMILYDDFSSTYAATLIFGLIEFCDHSLLCARPSV